MVVVGVVAAPAVVSVAFADDVVVISWAYEKGKGHV